MRVIYTDQSLVSLEELLNFLIESQGYERESVALIINQLFDRAESLKAHPHKGQLEENLQHLKEGHRRIIERYFKIIYKVEKETIYITDFFDSRQDPEKMKG
ncbi:type II toxin-antitoxin system RelE/ParE family toxin [Reichenbachiella sp.]|uniref:type II toxin-antitoxin system RelE/ParE family toxin n=1 Tax=Reichenbachiella sp. TaxID=2184521 RepID=UPI003B5C4F4B